MPAQVETKDKLVALKPVLGEIFDELVRYLQSYRPDFFQGYHSGMKNRDQEVPTQVPMEVLRNELRNILSQIYTFTAQEKEGPKKIPGPDPKSSSPVSAEASFLDTISDQSQEAQKRIEVLEKLEMHHSKSLQEVKLSCSALEEDNGLLQRQIRFLKLRNKALEDIQESHERERELFRLNMAGLRQKICHVHRKFVGETQKAKNAEQRCAEYKDRLHEAGATSKLWASRIKQLEDLHEDIFKHLVQKEETNESENGTRPSTKGNGGLLGLLTKTLTRNPQLHYESYSNQKSSTDGSFSKQKLRNGKEPMDTNETKNLPFNSEFIADKVEYAPLGSVATDEVEQNKKTKTNENSLGNLVPAETQKAQSCTSGAASGEDSLRRSPRSIFGVLSSLSKGPLFSRASDDQEDHHKSWSGNNAFRSFSGSMKFSPRTFRRVRTRHEDIVKTVEQARLELKKDTKALTDVIMEKQAEIERLEVELRKAAGRSGTFDIPSADHCEEEVGEVSRSLKFCSEVEFGDLAIRKNETLFEWDGPVSES